MSCIARERWNFLSSTIKHKKLPSPPSSIRKFDSFGFLEFKKDQEDSWWKCKLENLDTYISIRLQKQDFQIDILSGFNNTGNIGIWPSEEVLAHYCLLNKHYFKDKRVCEVGGGQSCFAGLSLLLSTSPSHILLTDGSLQCVSNVKLILERNKYESKSVQSRLLRWDQRDTFSDLHGSFDCVLMADCLFFEDGHKDIINMLMSILKMDGLAVIMAPMRGGSLNRFVEMAMLKMCVSVFEKYGNEMWEKQVELSKTSKDYNNNLHYPVLVILSKNNELKLNKFNT